MKHPTLTRHVIRCLLAAALLAAALPAAAQDDGPNTDSIARLMDSMSVHEKVAQLFILPVTTSDLTPALAATLADYAPGGVVLFGQESATPAEMLAFTNAMQDIATSAGAGIPLFVAADQEGWPVARLRQGFTIFPNNMVIAAADHGEHVTRIAQTAAAEMRAVGFNMNLAPVADVNSNALNAVIDTRSFGSDPAKVGELAAAMIAAYQDAGIIATAKHFPGHGDTSLDSHDALPVVRRFHYQIEQVELVPFQAAIDAGVDVIMTAHVSYPAFDQTPNLPATFSAPIITGLLREQMGFDGVIMSDSMLMGAITETYGTTEAAVLAFDAGVDILAYGTNGYVDYVDLAFAIDYLAGLVEQGEISTERLNQSLRRVLALKKRYGLLDGWEPPGEDGLRCVGTVFNDALVQNVAERAITLVRDDAMLLPLSSSTEPRVVIAYPEVIAPWLAEYVSERDPEAVLIPLDFDPTRAQVGAVARWVGEGTPVVVFTCDARSSPAQVRLVTAFEPALVVVALCSPYDLLAFPNVGTYLATYWELPLPAEAVVDVLYGAVQPAGTLPIALFTYPPGHGLSEFPRASQ